MKRNDMSIKGLNINQRKTNRKSRIFYLYNKKFSYKRNWKEICSKCLVTCAASQYKSTNVLSSTYRKMQTHQRRTINKACISHWTLYVAICSKKRFSHTKEHKLDLRHTKKCGRFLHSSNSLNLYRAAANAISVKPTLWKRLWPDITWTCRFKRLMKALKVKIHTLALNTRMFKYNRF